MAAWHAGNVGDEGDFPHRPAKVQFPFDRTEVICAVSRLVVVRPVGAAPVRFVYTPEALRLSCCIGCGCGASLT